MSNPELVIDIEREWETPALETETDWEKHMEKFQMIIGILVFYDKPESPENQVQSLISTLLQRLAPIEMVADPRSVPFEKVIACVK